MQLFWGFEILAFGAAFVDAEKPIKKTAFAFGVAPPMK
jgi:hypothetical protein